MTIRAASESKPTSGSDMEEKSGHKILVVDDEPDLERLMLQRMRREIRRGELSFVFAGNGVEALKKLNEDSTIDMVLSDINMPEMDGLTLLDQIPKVDPNIKSVIVSAYGDMKNIRTAMNRGAFDFVTKPLDFDDLRVTIDRTLQHLAMLRGALESRDKLVAIENELDIARTMQRAILPTSFPSDDRVDVYAGMEPAKDVSGDFFDVVPLGNGALGVAIADVSGKGVPAALFMMSSRTLLRGAAVGCIDPELILREINQLLNENNETTMFVTLFFASFNRETGHVIFANGGHNLPLLVHADGSSRFIEPTMGVALGIAPGIEFERGELMLGIGETLVLYTDGVTEAENVDQEQFGNNRLQELFATTPPTSAADATKFVFDAVSDFAGEAPQFDDITCLVLRRPGEST